jgi:glycosyltransferase involved in cell wall biosynthesis
MKALPLVSVGIPTRNRSHSLRCAVASVLCQTYAPVELIISDNASTDSTMQYCRDVCAVNSSILYLRSDANHGAAHNFNTVLLSSHGDYFMWLGDDDWLDAAREFVAENQEFVIDEPRWLFNEGTVSSRVTYWPRGFLKGIR